MRMVGVERINRASVLMGTAFFVALIAAVACQSSTPAPTRITEALSPVTIAPLTSPYPPTSTSLPTARFARTSGPTPSPLPDADVISLIREAVLRYGAAPESVRISISGEPRSVTVRYESGLSMDEGAFELQRTLSTIAVARIAIRTKVPPTGGLSVGIIPAGEADVGLLLTLIDGDTLTRWAAGEINDQQFVGRWETGSMTRE